MEQQNVEQMKDMEISISNESKSTINSLKTQMKQKPNRPPVRQFANAYLIQMATQSSGDSTSGGERMRPSDQICQTGPASYENRRARN
jgi:hypothetical protein